MTASLDAGPECRRLTPGLGAEVDALDLTDPSVLASGSLRKLLLRHGVLVFHDQPLTRAQHVAVGRALGELELFPGAEPSDPEVMRLVHDVDAPPSENIWHSDMSFRTSPPLGSVLRAVELPETGGDTLFADMRAVWRRLPAELRGVAGRLRAVHDIAKWAPASARQVLHDVAPPRAQPLLRQHPETGEEVLFVNEAYTTAVEGLDERDSAGLLDHLFRQVTVPEVQCRVRWRPGTVVVWDNRALQHYAVGDYLPDRRVMERVTVAGDEVRGAHAALVDLGDDGYREDAAGMRARCPAGAAAPGGR